MLVRARFAEELLALEEAALGRIELAQERADLAVGNRRRPFDPTADLLRDLAQQPGRLRAGWPPQQLLQHLKLEGAIGAELPLGEAVTNGRFPEIAEQHTPRQ